MPSDGNEQLQASIAAARRLRQRTCINTPFSITNSPNSDDLARERYRLAHFANGYTSAR
jgi:hypothetical protein